MLKKAIILIILSLATISCEKPEPQEKTYTIVLNKEKYEKRVAEIENAITNKNYEKANEMVRRLKTTKGLKNYTLEYKKFAHEYKEMKE